MSDGAPWGTPDIDTKKGGLPCRGGCTKTFRVDLSEVPESRKVQVLVQTARLREFHELSVHDYRHKKVDTISFRERWD